MELEELDITGIIASMPDPDHFIMRLAPQEIDRLASVLYEGLKQSSEKINQQGLTNLEAVHKVFYDSLSAEFASIEKDLAVKNLARKIDMEFILQQVIS